jgi:DMSO/TMAO reductase YedYZ molybdopterin-dependent catalytic subunit
MTRLTPRESDERDLEWLRLRRAGLTAEEIASRYGVAKETVKVRTLEVRTADIAEAAYWGDKPLAVVGQYWDSKAARNAGRKVVMRGIRKDGLKGGCK